MNRLLSQNHKKYLERKALYKSFGCDIDKERAFVLKKARPFSGRILEAGTGKGHFAIALAKTGHRFTTFDISKTEQKFAKLNLRHLGLDKKVRFCIQNGEGLSFKSGAFDTIFSVNTIHHLSKPYKFLDELIRVASGGAKLIISDFTNEGFKLLEKIHAVEGRSHSKGKAAIIDVEKYLKKNSFKTKVYKTKFQQVLVAKKQ